MTENSKPPKRVAVIGGGISGLAAAHHLAESSDDCQVVLFESRDRLGGALWTIHEDDFQIEQGVDNFITTLPWGLDLCRRLGLDEELAQTDSKYRQTFVVRRGRLHKLPDGFLMMAPTQMWPLALTPILSPLGKLRCAVEYVLPRRKDEADESMANFVRRRLGREAYERLVEPLVSAVYAADLEKLSVEATLSRFRDMEREHGSLIRAMRRQMAQRRQGAKQSGPRFSMFVTLRRGLSSLVDAVAKRLPKDGVQLNTEVEQLQRASDRWQLTVKSPDVDAQSKSETFDAVILATPSYVTGRLLRETDPQLAEQLESIDHSSTAVITFGYRREQIDHPLDGMGIVVPGAERSPILACSLSSRKYPHRSPDGKVLLRVFVGGSRFPEMAGLDEAELLPRIHGELAQLLGIHGEPLYRRVARWPQTMPQYYVGHKQLVAGIDDRVAELPGLEVCGNAYRGVGIPDCIHGGENAARRVLGISDSK